MKSSPNNLQDRIIRIFPVSRPEGFSLAEATSLYEVAEFAGKKWTEIDSKAFAYNFDCFYFFSKEAFIYYCPALLFSAFADNPPGLAIDTFLLILHETDNDEWALERWSLFNIDQLKLILDWTEAVKNFAFSSNLEHLSLASYHLECLMEHKMSISDPFIPKGSDPS